MNSVEVDPETKVAVVGGGALLCEIESETVKFGLAAVVATSTQVGIGIGGLTLLGGYGWLSGEHGLALDNLVAAKVVTANGQVLTASKDQNSDLFWGIRGGGSNFGIVTEFHIALHTQRPTVFSSYLEFKQNQMDRVFEICDEMRCTMDPKAGALIQMIQGVDGPMLGAALFYNGSKEEGINEFQKLYDIGTIQSSRKIPYIQLNQRWNLTLPRGKSYQTAPFALSSTDTLAAKGPQISTEFSKFTSHNAFIGFELLSLDKINSVVDTAFNGRGDHMNFHLHVSAEDEIDMEKVKALVRGLEDCVGKGKTYGNYESETLSEDKVKNLYGDNYPRLQVLKAKYDPEMVFHKWFPIKPDADALSK